MTIHFVYTVPRGSNIVRRGIDKVINKLNLTPLHRYGYNFLIPWQKPVRAPHSISFNLLKALKKVGKVRFYSIHEKGSVKLEPGDIFIGQPVPQGGFSYDGRPEKDDYSSVTSATLRKYKGSPNKKFIIMPYANDDMLVGWAKDLVFNYSDGVILIGGKIWNLEKENASFYGLEKKTRVIRVDMAIDPKDYPRVKTMFNKKGKRGYFYIGHNSWYKNTKELENIAMSMPGYDFCHMGGGEVKGWKKKSEFFRLTKINVEKIAEHYDIFVNTSTADAQATTILEQICLGFPVACTPETGYDHPSITKLSTIDTTCNVNQLRSLQECEEKELTGKTNQAFEYVLKNHNWQVFCEKVLKFILS